MNEVSNQIVLSYTRIFLSGVGGGGMQELYNVFIISF